MEYTAILKELRDQGKTLLVSSHILSELSELCTSIGIIEQEERSCRAAWIRFCADQLVQSASDLDFQPERKGACDPEKPSCVQTIAVQGDEIKLGFLGDRQDEALLLQQLIDADVMVSSFMREKGSWNHCLCRSQDMKKRGRC